MITNASSSRKSESIPPIRRPVLVKEVSAARDLLRRQTEKPSGIGVLDHPQCAIRSHFNVANAVPDTPAFGGLGSPLAVEGNAIERLRCHPTHQRGAAPLCEHRAVVEQEIAGRDDWR